MRKKLVAIMTICTLLVGANGAVVSAHGSKQPSSHKKTVVCSVKKCKKTKTHKHNGKSYAAHKTNDGHKYHKTSGNKKNHQTEVHKKNQHTTGQKNHH